MPSRRKPPWASLPKYTPGQAPRRRQKAQKAWWEYALMFVAAFMVGTFKGVVQYSPRAADGKRIWGTGPIRRRRRWW
jgi:hypothetical protein